MQEICSSNPLAVTESCDSNNSQAWHHRSLKLGLKLKGLNILISSYAIQVEIQKGGGGAGGRGGGGAAVGDTVTTV